MFDIFIHLDFYQNSSWRPGKLSLFFEIIILSASGKTILRDGSFHGTLVTRNSRSLPNVIPSKSSKSVLKPLHSGNKSEIRSRILVVDGHVKCILRQLASGCKKASIEDLIRLFPIAITYKYDAVKFNLSLSTYKELSLGERPCPSSRYMS